MPQTDAASLTTTLTPFDNIGLAFSGGGFRAAAFSLGTLAYLNELKPENDQPLLRKVSYMSSASGGTIATTTYALYSTVSNDFHDYYKSLFTNLVGVSLLDKVFEKLNDDALWKDPENKKRNFINAFALAYDDVLFGGKTADSLTPKVTKTHLDEVCFNTTDFYKGLLFRQAFKLLPDEKDDTTFLYGNYIMHLNKGIEKKLKLGDILAASSCFPAGFEPIVFPCDFLHEGLKLEELELKTVHASMHVELQEVKWPELDSLYDHEDAEKTAAGFTPPKNVEKLAEALQGLTIKETFDTGFMDGGITDNQGLESLMRANDRRARKETSFKEFDLMMVNDVASHYMDAYKPSKKQNNFKGPERLSINNILWICGMLLVAGIACWCFSLVYNTDGWLSKLIVIVGEFLGTVLIIAPIILSSVILFLRKYISGKLKKGQGLNLTRNFSETIVKEMFHHFGKTPIGIIIQMIKDRFTSVITLNMDVFLKRVRQLLYQQFMDQGRKTFRLKTNHIYDLSFSNDRNRLQNDIADAPGTAMQIVAQHAFEMATTLWFDTADQKAETEAAIIACGQFTTCYNLLEYIARMKVKEADDKCYFDKLAPAYQQKVNGIEAQLKQHYALFKADPFWLYNSLGVDCDIPKFKKCTAAQFSFPKEFEGLRM